MCCFCRGEASARQYRTAAEEKVLLQQRLRQQIVINDGLQSKLADQKANRESVQQHRHEANRCLDKLAEAQVEKKQLQNRIDELEGEMKTVTTRHAIV